MSPAVIDFVCAYSTYYYNVYCMSIFLSVIVRPECPVYPPAMSVDGKRTKKQTGRQQRSATTTAQQKQKRDRS